MKKITLTQGKFALVDDSDFEWLNQWKWYCQKDKNRFYVRRSVGKKCILMHRLIMGSPKEVDHRNGNGLDNQRKNLRACLNVENHFNKSKHKIGQSKFKGVGKPNKKYRARIRFKGKFIHLGYFNLEKEAAKAYDIAAIKYFGDFAHLNFPKDTL